MGKSRDENEVDEKEGAGGGESSVRERVQRKGPPQGRPHHTSISDRHPYGKRRAAMAKLDLSTAYQRVFAGTGDEQQAQMVLADLAQFAGFYAVSGGSNDPVALGRFEGGRAVFGRIMSHVNMTDQELDALQRAARQESIVNQVEGEF